MVNAYNTEGFASVPVIALTEEFYEYFSNHKHREYYSKDYDPIPRVFRKYKDGDKEFHYIDYMTICLESLDWQRSKKQLELYRSSNPDEKNIIMSEGYRQNIDDWLNRHARNIESAYSAADDENVRKKYVWLCSYHNEIASNFTPNPNCQCAVAMK